MRKAIIFGALAALLGLATVAQASDDDAAPGARQVAQEVAQERVSGDRYRDHDRYERREHARDMRDHDDDGDDDGHDRTERHDRSHNDRD